VDHILHLLKLFVSVLVLDGLLDFPFSMINDVYISLQPHSPDNRALASECKDVKIDRVYIGSCTGGKTEDFMAAAKVFLTSVRSLTSLLYMLHNSFVTYILAWIKSLFFSSFHFILFTLSGV